MIPSQNIVAWGNVVPWADPRQIEQDLIICRALIDIFTDEDLRNALRFMELFWQKSTPSADILRRC